VIAKKCFGLEELLSESNAKFFAAIIKSEPSDEYAAAAVAVLAQLGYDTSSTNDWFVSSAALINALNTPDCDDLKIKAKNFVASSIDFIRMQPGFETFPKSKKLRADPQNKEFFDLYDGFIASTLAIHKNPLPAEAYFNSQTSAFYAHVMVLLLDIKISSSESSSESN
jgi:hypothetical protein